MRSRIAARVPHQRHRMRMLSDGRPDEVATEIQATLALAACSTA
jgi:hypothetical protein